MAYTDPVTWVAGNPLPASDLNTYVRDNLRALHDKGADVVAATSISTFTTQFHKVTGNTEIRNITPYTAGGRLTLWFTGTPLVKHLFGGSGQIHLRGGSDYQVVADDFLQLVSDGTDWYQVPALTSATKTSQLGADVTMTPANTYVDGPSLSLEPGKWLLVATLTIQAQSSQGNSTIKVWDGSTVGASAQNKSVDATSSHPMSVSCVVTLAATTTWKVSAAADVNNWKIKAAAPTNAAGNTASTLVAVRL